MKFLKIFYDFSLFDINGIYLYFSMKRKYTPEQLARKKERETLWRKNNPEKIKGYWMKYLKNHPEAIQQRNDDHKEYRKDFYRTYYQENKERIMAQTKAYYEEHKEERAAYYKRYNRKKK